MNDFSIVVLISGQGTNLQAIIDSIAKKTCSAEIVAVISNRECAYGLVRAKQAGIPTKVVAPYAGESRDDYDKRLYETIIPFQPKLIVLAGFMRILSSTFIDSIEIPIINIHPSLLPKYPGLETHEKVLANRDRYHGITIHRVTPELDAGPMLYQVSLTVHSTDTMATLTERIHQLEYHAYPQVINWFAEQRIQSDSQGYRLDEQPLPLLSEAYLD